MNVLFNEFNINTWKLVHIKLLKQFRAHLLQSRAVFGLENVIHLFFIVVNVISDFQGNKPVSFVLLHLLNDENNARVTPEQLVKVVQCQAVPNVLVCTEKLDYLSN